MVLCPVGAWEGLGKVFGPPPAALPYQHKKGWKESVGDARQRWQAAGGEGHLHKGCGGARAIRVIRPRQPRAPWLHGTFAPLRADRFRAKVVALRNWCVTVNDALFHGCHLTLVNPAMLTLALAGAGAVASGALPGGAGPNAPWCTTTIDYSAANKYCATHYRCEQSYFAQERVEDTPIYDGRSGVLDDEAQSVLPASLASCGFALRTAPTGVDDWESLEQIRDRYVPELREAMLKALGNDRERVSQIIYWNPMLRGEEWGPADLVTDESRGGATAWSNIASMAHLDTDILLFGGNAEELVRLIERNSVEAMAGVQPPRGASLNTRGRALADGVRSGHRFAIVNAWRNIDTTSVIRRAPLAVLATRYPTGARSVVPEQAPCPELSRWYVFPRMAHDEVLLFKQYDRDVTRPSDTWHCALKGAEAAESDAPPRRSFELRCFVLFDDVVPSASDRFKGEAMPKLTHVSQRGVRGLWGRAESRLRRLWWLLAGAR